MVRFVTETCMCVHISVTKMVHYGIWDWCTVGYVRQVYTVYPHFTSSAGTPGWPQGSVSVFSGHNYSHYNDKTVVGPSYLYNGNTIFVRLCIYIETAPTLPGHLFRTLPKLTRTRAVRYVDQGFNALTIFNRTLNETWCLISRQI